MCSFSDVERHNPSLLKVLETAYNEAVSSTCVGEKRKRGICAYIAKSDEPSGSLRETVVKCVCLSLLPFSFPESPGFRGVLSFLGRSSEGLSARSVVIEMQNLYTKMKGERLKDFIAAFDVKTGDDPLRSALKR